jgi:hypothetical protein
MRKGYNLNQIIIFPTTSQHQEQPYILTLQLLQLGGMYDLEHHHKQKLHLH